MYDNTHPSSRTLQPSLNCQLSFARRRALSITALPRQCGSCTAETLTNQGARPARVKNIANQHRPTARRADVIEVGMEMEMGDGDEIVRLFEVRAGSRLLHVHVPSSAYRFFTTSD
jgi:hypothetical protein